MSVELTLWKWNTHKVGVSAAVRITYLDTQLQLFYHSTLFEMSPAKAEIFNPKELKERIVL